MIASQQASPVEVIAASATRPNFAESAQVSAATPDFACRAALSLAVDQKLAIYLPALPFQPEPPISTPTATDAQLTRAWPA